MIKNLQKKISLFLIIALLLGRVGFVVPAIYADDPAPTSPPAPTSAPAPPSDPAPTSPPSDPQPTRDAAPTSAPLPTSAPQPTNSQDQDAPSPSPTVEDSQADPSQQEEGSDGQENYASSEDPDVNDPANIATGPLSENSASETLEEKMEILNENLAKLQNKIEAISATGFSHADLNTLDGEVFTGDSVSTLNLLNKLNSNIGGVGGFSVFNIYDTYIGDIVFQLANPGMLNSFNEASATVSKNSLTGPGSSNSAVASNEFEVKEANGNDAEIVNDIVLESSTGGNSASGNTGGGSVDTGDALALGNIVNLANTNLNVSQWLFGVVNIWGTLLGDIILPQDEGGSGQVNPSETVLVENKDTGPGSSNSASYQESEIVEFKNINSAEITSNLDVSANTGNNSASVNTGGGSVTTGMADAAVQNTTVANSNTVNEEETVWMIIVNEAGKWVGHILGDLWGATTASNSLPFTSESGGTGTQVFSTVVQNTDTGPLSTNEASFSQTSDTLISSENSAEIVNNVKANADSGNNEASYNTGKGEVETGDAKVGLNLMNMVNTNVVAKKFVAVFVNVLGTFLGDVIPPQQQSDQQENNGDNYLTDTSSVDDLPSLDGLPSFNEGIENIGGVADQDDYYSYSGDNNYVDGDTQTQVNYPQQYRQAVYRVSLARNKVVLQKKLLQQGVSSQNYLTRQPTKVPKQGIFLSPAFAKATETSFAGMLLGGASLRVSNTWLSIVPIALLLFFLRRKRKFNLTKYVNRILEVLL